MKRYIGILLATILMLTVCFLGACAPEQPNNPDNPPSVQDPSDKDGNKDDDGGKGEGQTPSDNPDDGKDGEKGDGDGDVSKPDTPPEDDGSWVTAIFGGGPFVTGGDLGLDNVASTLKTAGYNTVIIWAVHVNKDGTLALNDDIVCRDGELLVSEETLAFWAGLKEGKTDVKRVELSIGAWGTPDFENIRYYIKRDGEGEDTVLYKNFAALIKATGCDAINLDDESCYDLDYTTRFCKMCAKLGVTVALCPYDFSQINFWAGLKQNLGELVDRVYVQCYDGGAGNVPTSWTLWQSRIGMNIIPGYFGGTDGSNKTTAALVATKLAQNKSCITGGFMWLYDDIQKLPAPNSLTDYSNAIKSVNPKNAK